MRERKDGEAGALEAGDVVAATGIAEPDERYPSRVATVQRAGEDSPGVVGVVQSRMAWVAGPQKDGESALESVPGTAGPGDCVRLAVLGVASVRVQPGATIRAGERLTPGGFAGEARPLRVRRIDGFTVAEATPVVGTALESSDGSRAEILAFVSTRKGLNLLLDFAGVDYLSSAALTELIKVNDAVVSGGGSMRICGLTPQIQKVFEITRFDKSFDIHAGEKAPQAVARFKRSIALAKEQEAWEKRPGS